MGGIISHEKKVVDEHHIQKHRNEDEAMSAIEEFLRKAFEKSPSIEALQTIVKNNRARQLFFDFLRNAEEMSNPIQTADNSESSTGSYPMAFFLNKLMKIHKEDDIVTGDSPEDISYRLKVLDLFPKFISSEYYDTWRKDEIVRAFDIVNNPPNLLTTIPDIVMAEPSAFMGKKLVSANACYSKSNRDLACHVQLCLEINTFPLISIPTSSSPATLAFTDFDRGDTVDDVLATIDHFELPIIMRMDSWMFLLLSAMENIPISFSIATASSHRLGFPLVFVNKYFEVLTGYKRCDVIGETARFLQRNQSGQRMCETDSVNRMSYSLRNAHPTIVKITNYRKNGDSYHAFVAMKPIFDVNGEYRYVVSIQFDVTDDKAVDRARVLTDSLMKSIPNFIWSLELDQMKNVVDNTGPA
eukprot:gene12733-26818_t